MNKVTYVIVPVFDEQENINLFYENFNKLSFDGVDLKLVFVDDGSKDNTPKIIEEICKKNKEVKLLQLTKNFGKEMALTAAIFELKNYDSLIFIDSDLQHPINLIPELIKYWIEGNKVVACVRKNDEKKNILKKIFSITFNWLMNRISNLNLQSGITDFCIIDRSVAEEIKKFGEQNRFFRGILDWTGVEKKFIFFSAPIRKHGVAKYNIKKLISLAVNSVTYYSNFPLKLIIYLGLSITFFALISLIIILCDYMFNLKFNFTISGFAIMINTLLSGIILVSLGLISIYVSSILKEVLSRPLYVIKKKTNFN